ncbi:MAG: hypothetical protein H6705_09700 [Myxococcales bacterium]|nr:hypothetical protein [Myxococcales bacterium]
MDLHAHLLARLAADGEGLARLAVDHVFATPLSTFINPERVDLWLDDAFDEGLLRDAIEQHARGFITREQARARERGDTVRDWLPAEAQAELRALAARPVKFRRETLERLVDQDAVRDILRALVQETLDRFVETFKPGGSGGGLIGAVGRGAIGIAGRASRGLLGGLGSQFEDALRAGVGAFVSGSMGMLSQRFISILMQPETATRLGRMRLSAYDRAVAAPTTALWDAAAAEEATIADLVETLPAAIAHNLDRPEVRAIVRAELGRWVEAEGERPIRSFLPAARAETLRDEIAALAAPLLEDFARSDGFREWLGGGETAI